MNSPLSTGKGRRPPKRLPRTSFLLTQCATLEPLKPIVLALGTAMCLAGFGSQAMGAEKPKIAVFSGPTATVQNSQPLITSNKARLKHGLPPLTDASGEPLTYDVLFAQRLAAPAKVYVRQFSAHPLESDVPELYAPPDGYIDKKGNFHKQRQSDSDVPVYEIVLKPEDGVYPLPYMALQASGKPWDDVAAYPDAPFSQSRQTFYADASRILEEIERAGGGVYGMADFDFYRPSPAGGYTKGLPSSERTDEGDGDIPPEKLGEDFWAYGPYSAEAPRTRLAKVTNMVQKAFDSGQYEGGIWLEGSPNIEDTVYWLNLLIDTTKPIAGNAAQRRRGMVSADGDGNIVDSVHYITSRVWEDDQGRNQVGVVLVQDQQIFASREVQKGDARPGGYVATGGHGGIVGSLGQDGPRITFLPNRKHTYRSELRYPLLPSSVKGVRKEGARIKTVTVQVKNADGEILSSAIPMVSIVKGSRWHGDDSSIDASREPDILARLGKNLASYPLSGAVAEGLAPYGKLVLTMESALTRLVLSGIPVIKASRGNAEGFMRTDPENLFIEGQNMTATKARILLIASIMKLGMLPPAVDPDNPTEAELSAIRERVQAYQEILHTH
jgi:L-asparaginase